ncbi:MAG: VCBS repeat-containing protein, partial [gamma proteobacterium endosymbiont of Lamellibrachia anaximandri]|nr:VCBS repeat-containing protein [gamma proteobacterium endosymbiont of Lamellibrachia anaximandri]
MYLFIFFLLTCFIVSPAFSAFTDQTALRLPAATDNSYSQTVADIDGDGDSDLLVNNSGQSRLLINDGSGVFDDQTGARLPVLDNTLIDADFGDVDGDNDLDLALASVFGQNRVFINNGAGIFSDESLSRLPFDRCQPWRAKRRLVVPGSREAALLTRRALRQRGSKVGIRARRP